MSDIKKGIVFLIISSLLVSFLFAYMFRYPIPFEGYIGPFSAINANDKSMIDILVSVIMAWAFYFMFGGIVILSLLGAATGNIVGRIYSSSPNKNKFILIYSLIVSTIPVYFLSILDYIIGPW